jgi:hypothetical protein
MRWPFGKKREQTDLRIFRHPKNGELTLRMRGMVGWPSGDRMQPIIAFEVTIDARVTEEEARLLRDQIDALLPAGSHTRVSCSSNEEPSGISETQ